MRTTIKGTCHHDCPDSCGWVATADDGVLVELRGNPDHPASYGELCPKVNKFVQRVNHADRLLQPKIRIGAKGAGEFRDATWDEALDLIARETTSRIDRFGSETLLPWWSAGNQGLLQHSSLGRTLFGLLGASQQTGSICGATAAAGMASVYGEGLGADPFSLVGSELVILWGTNTKLTNRHLWPKIEEARASGARLVVVDPLRTVTAQAADEHVQPMPGTDVALLLAMMHVLVRDDLIDHQYVERHSSGFEKLVAQVADCSPAWAADRCGVPAEIIGQLATDYGTAQPAFIRALIGAEHHPQGAEIFRCLAILPVLTGSWQHPNGGFARSVGLWQTRDHLDDSIFDRDDAGNTFPTRRLFEQPRLAQTLTQAEPPVTALFIWNGNPVVSMPNTSQLRAGLEREELFTVVSEQFITDTATYAEVLLPAAMQTEQLDVVPAWGHLWLGWNEPAGEPLGGSVPNTELFRRLAGALGVRHPLFDLDDASLVERCLGDGIDLETLRSSGYVRVPGTEDLTPYADGGFHTDDGRAHLFDATGGPNGLAKLPTYQPSNAGSFPLALMTPKQQLRFLNTSYSSLADHRERERFPMVEMSAGDAHVRSLADGDQVTVFNEGGSVELQVKISERVRDGLVSIPGGWGGNTYGAGRMLNDLVSDIPTDRGGGAGYSTTWVEVTALGAPTLDAGSPR